jgi:hypothetical protein
MDTPIGTQKFVWTIQPAGAGWSGSMESRAGTSEMANVNVVGDRLSFDTAVNSPMGSVQLAFSGAAAGDTISGTCKTRFGDTQFSGVRG